MNVSPGDLAIVMRCSCRSNIGAIVEVLARDGVMERLSGQPAWDCRASRFMVGFWDLSPALVGISPGEIVVIADSQLQRVRGPEIGFLSEKKETVGIK